MTRTVASIRRAGSACSVLLAAALGFAPGAARAADIAACAPAPEVKAALDRLPSERGPDQSERLFREERVAAMRALVQRFPGDLFVQRKLIEFQYWSPARTGLIDEYKRLHEGAPDDPGLAYLYGLTLLGRRTPEAIALFEAVVEKHPRFPWPRLPLVEAYTWAHFSNREKAASHIKAFFDLCPATLEGYGHLERLDDPGLLAEAAGRLRLLLQTRRDEQALDLYPTLWSLEFKSRPAAERAQASAATAADLKRIRALGLRSMKQWYTALLQGYRLLDDQKMIESTEKSRARRFPDTYIQVARDWFKKHPYPEPEDLPDEQRAYYSSLLNETDAWVKEHPDKATFWNARLEAIEHLDDVPASVVETTVERMVRLGESDAGPWGASSQNYLYPARELSRRGLLPERVVELARKGVDQIEPESRMWQSDFDPPEANDDDFYSDSGYVEGLTLEADGDLGLRRMDEARTLLAEIDQRLQRLKSRAGDKAILQKNCSSQESSYWDLLGRLAEAEGRRPDAMAFYQNSLLSRIAAGQLPTPGVRDVLAIRAHRLWDDLGGTEEGWREWYGRKADALAAGSRLTWKTAAEPLPSFELADLGGKVWRSADLRGKVVLLNFWASW